MRSSLTDVHVRLLRGIREVIAADETLAGWLARPFDLVDAHRLDVHRLDKHRAEPARGLVIENFESEPWASLTFLGMRHRLDVRLSGEEAHVADAYDRLKALLADPPLNLPGHFVAELELIDSLGEIRPDGRMDLSVRIEALTIEE